MNVYRVVHIDYSYLAKVNRKLNFNKNFYIGASIYHMVRFSEILTPPSLDHVVMWYMGAPISHFLKFYYEVVAPHSIFVQKSLISPDYPYSNSCLAILFDC